MNNLLKTTLLLTALTLLLVFAGRSMGGQRGMMAAFVLAAGINFGVYWFSDRLILSHFRAEAVSEYEAPEVYALVSEIASEAGLPLPRIYILPSASPNAFATGRDPRHSAIVLSKGLIDLLNAEELQGVIAHEMSHILHRDTLIASITATMAGAIGMLASSMRWMFIAGSSRPSGRGSNPLGVLAMILLAPLTATLIRLAVSRSREFAADEEAARLCHEPLYLAHALSRIESEMKDWPLHQAAPETAHLFIVSPLHGTGWARLFSTHPPIFERIARLERLGRTGESPQNVV